MKKFILHLTVSIFFLSGGLLHAQNYWLSSYSPTNINLKRVMFVDSMKGWVVGDSGLIMHTTNGGTNWTIQNSKTKVFLHDVFFLNERLGWALGWNIYNPQPPYGSYYLKTTDGGSNWDTSFFPMENVFLGKVYFQDSLYGFLGGATKNLLRTTDGGASWLDVIIDSLSVMNFPVTNFVFFNNDYGYAGGGLREFAGMIWRTTDRGLRWTPLVVSPEPILNMFFFDSLRVLGFGGDLEYGVSVITTSNSGANWKYVPTDIFGLPDVLKFRDLKDGWGSMSGHRMFLFTQDSGKSFVLIPATDSAAIIDIDFPDKKHGYAVGDNGKILKFNHLTIGIHTQDEIITKGFELMQNFPNPFNPSTTISYELRRRSYVVLKIYDITGKEIRTLKNGFQNEGKYNIKFGSDFLTSGVYFYRIVVRDLTGKSNDFFTQTKKMLLIK